jgi:hypothetical protein
VRLEVADIFRTHGDAYRRTHEVDSQQLKAMRAIETCRTAVLGGHLDVCPGCGEERPSYNSCRNRHCPKCQGLRQARWVAQRQDRILPTRHFHVVFTVPAQLRPLAIGPTKRRFFELLFAAVSSTLLELGGDPKRLGAQLAITGVLHTWTRELEAHPHIHCVVSAGGLNDDRWIHARRNYLFPVKVMAKLFRGKLLAAIDEARSRGELVCAAWQEPKAFARLKDALYEMKWVVYAKRPFGDATKVFHYLGQYTHRVAISNHRLISMDEAGVHFVTRGEKTATLSTQRFIHRFLLHILPDGFVKIRHYGLLAAGNVNGKLEVARRLLLAERERQRVLAPHLIQPLLALFLALHRSQAALLDWRMRLILLTGIDPLRCRRCGALLERRPLPRPSPTYLDSS